MNKYIVYWLKDGKEHEGERGEKNINYWIEWAKLNTDAYGYEKKLPE
jgi:hypothetical protein